MPANLDPGTEFAGHLIEAEVGRGGMGIVYRARHLALDRIRALKILAPELSGDDAYALRFRRECRLAASVEHPNLVTIHHAGEEDGRLYMSMQYVDGRGPRAAARRRPAAARTDAADPRRPCGRPRRRPCPWA